MTLRDYQQDLFDRIHGAIRRGVRNPLVVSPTGSGKTVLFSYISNRIQQAGNRVIILVHRKELVSQTSKTLRQFGIPHGIIQAGIRPEPSARVQVAMVQTLSRRLLKIIPPNLIICDEAHHMAAGDYRKIVSAFPKAHVIGFTATPQRLDGKGLSDFFNEIIMGPSVQWLMDEGFLSKCKYYELPVIANLDGLGKRGGDFKQDQSALAMDSLAVTADAVKQYLRICPNAPAIAFCVTIAHANHVSRQFNDAGVKSACIFSGMSNEERKQIVLDLAGGKINVMTACDIVSEGFDVPVVTSAILLRPTASLGLHLQQIGRVLRPSQGKENAFVLDHVRNLRRHGLAEDSREWSLEGQDKNKKESESLGLKQCPECYCLHAPAPVCPECGHAYVEKVFKPKPSELEVDLQEFSRGDIFDLPLKEILKTVRTRADLKLIQAIKGYKPGWIHFMSKELNLR